MTFSNGDYCLAVMGMCICTIAHPKDEPHVCDCGGVWYLDPFLPIKFPGKTSEETLDIMDKIEQEGECE